jgi:hypothetical protein
VTERVFTVELLEEMLLKLRRRGDGPPALIWDPELQDLRALVVGDLPAEAYIPILSARERARYNAALARAFWRDGQHEGFW